MGAQRVDQLPGIRILIIAIAVLHQELMQCEVHLIFADIIGERVHDLAALLVPDVTFALDERQGAFAPGLG